jgi:hypothetical protein
LFAFCCWALFAMAAMRFEGTERTPENHLRLALAAAGTALTLFAVLRAGTWPRLLYLVSVSYLAYFAAGGAWGSLWQIAAIAPTDTVGETLALTLELAYRLCLKENSAGNAALALAQAYDLAVMPLVQLMIAIYAMRAVASGSAP